MNRTDLLITFASCLEKPPEPGTLRGDELCGDLRVGIRWGSWLLSL